MAGEIKTPHKCHLGDIYIDRVNNRDYGSKDRGHFLYARPPSGATYSGHYYHDDGTWGARSGLTIWVTFDYDEAMRKAASLAERPKSLLEQALEVAEGW